MLLGVLMSTSASLSDLLPLEERAMSPTMAWIRCQGRPSPRGPAAGAGGLAGARRFANFD